jgi:hypothetical protein
MQERGYALLIGLDMKRIIQSIIGLVLLAAALFFSFALFRGSRTIEELLGNNTKLKAAIATLTHEDQIGFAKVVKKEYREGRTYTTLRFVETARDNLLERVLEKEYEIEGDVIYFDALIITFENQMVMDGKARSLYLWRRIYSDKMRPEEGFPIEIEGEMPKRYADLLAELGEKEQELFWEHIWELSNDPEALKAHGIKAIYGNAVYKKLRQGLIYVFKIGAGGHVYPETVLDL